MYVMTRSLIGIKKIKQIFNIMHCFVIIHIFQHFVGGNGPSENYPDPIQADGSRTMPVRKLPVKRASSQQSETCQYKYKCLHLEEDFTT